MKQLRLDRGEPSRSRPVYPPALRQERLVTDSLRFACHRWRAREHGAVRL